MHCFKPLPMIAYSLTVMTTSSMDQIFATSPRVFAPSNSPKLSAKQICSSMQNQISIEIIMLNDQSA